MSMSYKFEYYLMADLHIRQTYMTQLQYYTKVKYVYDPENCSR